MRVLDILASSSPLIMNPWSLVRESSEVHANELDRIKANKI
jgi:hypothetical protein